MTDKPTSILYKVRHDGYRDGWSQASMICYDDAYLKGQKDAEADIEPNFKWWLFLGIGCGAGLAAIVSLFI